MNAREFENSNSNLITINMAREKYNLGMTMVRNIAEKSNSLVRIGRCVRIDVDKFEDFIFNTQTNEKGVEPKVIYTKKSNNRIDPNGNFLRVNEFFNKRDHNYVFKYIENGERKSFSANTLTELREKEKTVNHITDQVDNMFLIKCEYEFKNELDAISKKYMKNFRIIIEEEVSKYNDFIRFFKDRLPDTYEMLWKEFISEKGE